MLYENAKKAVEEKGIQAEIVKVEDMDKIAEYGVMMTPALVMDGKVKSIVYFPRDQMLKDSSLISIPQNSISASFQKNGKNHHL